MNDICKDIFKAIHEGKWLSIEYKNQSEQITKYWIGILGLDISRKALKVDGLHLGHLSMKKLDIIYIDAIISSEIIEGTYCEINKQLVKDINSHPEKYKLLFDNVANLRILNYLEDCYRMDATPYKTDFELLRYLDAQTLKGESFPLNEQQFQTIVTSFQLRSHSRNKNRSPVHIQELAMNLLSLHTHKGLYVMAYRKLELDVKLHVLKPDEDITICKEFTIDGIKESIRKFLDAEDYELLNNFSENQECIKDRLVRAGGRNLSVDDKPYIIGLGIDIPLNLHKEYASIIKQYEAGSKETTVPIKAFFGDLLSRPVRKKEYPIALLNRNINLDQLLSINNAMKHPVAYIQGPPGTGKTNTIINTVSTAFFNERTVLFTSYNNHPIDSVLKKLISLKYNGRNIPFPVVRLGNLDKMKEALIYITELYQQTANVKIYDTTLLKNKEERTALAEKLSNLLKQYEEVLELRERDETLQRLLEYNGKLKGMNQSIPFNLGLQTQQDKVRQIIAALGEIREEDALNLLTDSEEEFRKYLYYTSARYIKKIDEPKNRELKDILYLEDEAKRLEQFGKYLSSSENLARFIKIFPVVITTCISASKLGQPQSHFDMVIMDEASQCNTAVSLVPILRGNNLMLVGDPQQLNPVILLDETVNRKLRQKYGITDEYDYCKNSIYKTFLACDSVSEENLLHYHYRCHKNIIGFNNQKYYNSKLIVKTEGREQQPLLYIDIQGSTSNHKNTAPGEISEIIRYASGNKDKTIGVITPFVNQKKEIEAQLKENGLTNITCGTVHSFQGDEKDVILFSTAITDKTNPGTYEWLKNNKELINVATSRAKEKLIVLSNMKSLYKLHEEGCCDDLYELIQYVQTKGTSHVTTDAAQSRALGVKPFSTETEEAFLESLNHALGNIWQSGNRFTVKKEVGVAHVFQDNISCTSLFYSGRFDFVVYEKNRQSEIPVLAIELDGKEHFEDEVVKERDRMKKEICQAHNLELIRIENTYARRYYHIKEILIQYFHHMMR